MSELGEQLNPKFRMLNSHMSVAPQLALEDIADLVKAGYKTVICHRPDAELSASEPSHDVIAEHLAEHDISLIYQPIENITMPEVERFTHWLRDSEGAVLAYCASGTRSTVIWGLGQVFIERNPRGEIAEAAERAGYSIGQYLS